MTLISVPRPDKSSYNPDRRLNSNIKAQLRQFQEVEASLPSAFKTGIYVGAIRTEGEAAEYIKQMTENLLRAHVVSPSPRRKKRGAGSRARTMPTPSVSMSDDLSASPAGHRTKAQESWDVFISHASEDKEAIAAPLAQALLARGLRVWYDDLSLNWETAFASPLTGGLRVHALVSLF
jgi:TIR domain-containing protein